MFTATHSSKPTIANLCDDLTRSLRHPCGKTLRLLDRALKLLIPFESPKAAVTSAAERQDLLTLLRTHRLSLSPYIDTDRIESNLRQ